MSCNARVVIKAKVEIDTEAVLKNLKDQGFKVVSQANGRYVFYYGNSLFEFGLDGKAELRSSAATWDEGVQQLKTLAAFLGKKVGVKFTATGEPETHRHDEVTPWQKVRN